MASTCLIDTSGLVASRDRGDDNHSRARTFLQQSGIVFHTTTAALGETFTLMRGRLGYEPARATVDAARASNIFVVHGIGASEEERVWRLLEEYRAHRLSYVDATLMVIGSQLGITRVFTFDSDFALAGFEVVPR